MKHVLTICCAMGLLISISIKSAAQNTNPYHLNGNAYQENCNCYTLTPDGLFQSGSVWNINKISLDQSFDYKFNVFLGCGDTGADGIVFVLQPISTSIGSSGGGLGYLGVSPSIGVAIDTYQNAEHNDPAFDHITIHRNGNISHNVSDNLAGPVSAISNNDNIEDCQWHTFRIIWDASSKVLKAQIDGVDRVSATIDIVKDVLGGNPEVFWGFTGSTGGQKNHQRVCTSLNPGFALLNDQGTCFPEPVEFKDSSASFGSILKWYWDFGDGTIDSSSSSPAPHVYPSPGEYNVQLKILGNNGCLSDPFTKTIIAGSRPSAHFLVSPEIICEHSPVNFIDSSYVEFGTINTWEWQIGGKDFSEQSPRNVTSNMPGSIPAQLKVKTKEGCESEISSMVISTLPSPKVDFSYMEECLGTPSQFQGINLDPAISIKQWYWNLGDNTMDSSFSISHLYDNGGTYPVQLFVTGSNGCNTVPIIKEVNIYETNAFAGNDTVVADTQPLQLQASGGVFYSWSPSTGLSDPQIANPIATLNRDMSYILTASSPQGCVTSDTINIKVFKGPAIYVPNAFTPNGDGKNDQLRFIAAGITSIEYFNVYNRYGQLVYRSNTFEQGWDGMMNGSQQPSGVYVWMIKGKDFNGEVHIKKGTVVLLR